LYCWRILGEFMSKSNTWESDLLKLVFQNVTAAGIGDGTGLVGSGTAGVLYLSLHTADPTEGGNQQSSEATYTNYTRISVVRGVGTWTVTQVDIGPSTVTNAAQVTFPQAATASPTNIITHVGVGTAFTGTGKLLYSGALASSLTVSQNITPSFAAGTLVITED
jgi:hypothetical protein